MRSKGIIQLTSMPKSLFYTSKKSHFKIRKSYIMKQLGYLLIGLGAIDLIASWTLENGSPIDPIVGPAIAPFTAYILLGLGVFLKGRDNEGDENKAD